LLDTSLARLSTGLKINSGKDSPSGLIASEILRSEISAIEQSIKNSNRANNVLSTADSALGEISGLLNQVRGLVQEGLNDGALSQSEIEANQLQLDAALSAINRIAANTTFAGDKLIDGSKAFTTKIRVIDAPKLDDVRISEAAFGSSSTIAINASITKAAEQAEVRYAGGTLASNTTLEVAGSKGSQVLFLGASSNVTTIQAAINGVSDITGVDAVLGSGLTLATGAQAGTTAVTTTAIANTTTSKSAGTYTASTFDSGSNADSISLSSRLTGTAGHAITIDFDVAGGANAATTVAVSGNAIVVTLGTDGNSAVNATAQDISDAVTASAGSGNDADALVRVAAVDSNASEAFAATAALTLGVGGDSGNVVGANDGADTRTYTDLRATSTNGLDATHLNFPNIGGRGLGVSWFW
jgi:flagellin